MNEKEITEVLKEAKEVGIFKDLYCRTIRLVGEDGSNIIITTENIESAPMIALQSNDTAIFISVGKKGAYLSIGKEDKPKVVLQLTNDMGDVILYDDDGNRRHI